MPMSATRKTVTTRFVVDTVLMAIIGPLVPIFYVGLFTPFRRGFFCDDETIRYPYHDSTVTDPMLYGIGAAAGIISVLAAQLLRSFCSEHRELNRGSVRLLCFRVPYSFVRTYLDLWTFLFGYCITDLLTNFIKYFVGRLRPNFIDVCQPDVNCSNTAIGSHEYILNYNCTNPDVDAVNDSRLSFPSGHSSVSTYCILFTMLYLHKNIKCPYSRLLVPIVQGLLFLMAAYTVASRLGDNKHHWSDLLGGVSLGAIICFCMFRIPADLKDDDDDEER